MEGVGGSVGPDLTRLWDTHTTEKMLETIVEPSKEIKEGYQSYKATTLDGQVFEGLQVTDTAKEVVIREASGRDVRIAKDDLDEMTPSKISLMPDNAVVAAQLRPVHRPAGVPQEPVRPGVAARGGAGVQRGRRVQAGPRARRSRPSWTPTRPASSPPGSREPSSRAARLDLAPVLPKGRSAAYALTYVYSPTRQTVTLHLTADDAVRVTVGKKQVFEQPVPLIPYPRKVDAKVEAELAPGWTPILVKLVTTGKEHRLGLQIQGEGLRTAGRPEKK